MENTKPLHEILQERELTGANFLTYTARPKAFERIETRSDLSPDGGKDTAILLTGPMVYEDHFTRDTIRLYRQHYPEALIILSTWDDEDKEYLNDLREDQVNVITNSSSKKGNKLDSARSPVYTGLSLAKKHNMQFVLRTGTAQRLYGPNVLAFFEGIQKSFPLIKTPSQTHRIIASSHASRKYVPFCISALFMHGHVDDLLKYWNGSKSVSEESSPHVEPDTVREQLQTQPGCYFANQYLNRIGVDHITDSIQQYWQILAERFCLIDREMVDLYWHAPSSSSMHTSERRESLYLSKNSQSMTFRDWLILYHTQGNHPSAPEWILDMPWGEKLDFRNSIS